MDGGAQRGVLLGQTLGARLDGLVHGEGHLSRSGVMVAT